MRRHLSLILVGALLMAGCGADGSGSSATTTVPPAEAAEEPTTTEEGASTSTTTEEMEGRGAFDPESDPADLPGEPFDMFPYEDAELAVVGVAHDDVLNLRAGPGTDFEVLEELAPTETGLVATGHNRSVGDDIWVEVDVDGATGWVGMAFVLHPGSVDDITSALDGLPRADTLEALGRAVGELRGSDDVESRIVVVDLPDGGDLGEVVVDVVGLADDAVGGERLHVFASVDGGDWVVRSVEATTMCSRGVDGGLCL